jgi:hypothetical protein
MTSYKAVLTWVPPCMGMSLSPLTNNSSVVKADGKGVCFVVIPLLYIQGVVTGMTRLAQG